MVGNWLHNWLGPAELSDEQAMIRVREHDDAQAFALLMNRWRSPIQRLCERMLGGDQHRAEDLSQETFVRLHGCRATYRPSAKFSTYLWRIALNLCHDELRRQRRRLEPQGGVAVPEDSGPGHPGPDEAVMASEDGSKVQEMLDQLQPEHREVLVLRHYEDLKFREIAELLQIPEGTVKSRMAEALNRASRLMARKPPSVRNRQSGPASVKLLL